MCVVFDATLQTDRGNKRAREYEEYFNAQLLWSKLYGFRAASIGARVNASDVLSRMTSEKIESYNGATEYFILNWQD